VTWNLQSKKRFFPTGPTLSECVGKEGVLLLKAAEQYEPSNADGNSDASRDTGRSPKEAFCRGLT